MLQFIRRKVKQILRKRNYKIQTVFALFDNSHTIRSILIIYDKQIPFSQHQATLGGCRRPRTSPCYYCTGDCLYIGWLYWQSDTTTLPIRFVQRGAECTASDRSQAIRCSCSMLCWPRVATSHHKELIYPGPGITFSYQH